MKSTVVLDYNEGKQDIDLSKQLSTYYTCLRWSQKWHHNVAFEMIFRVSIVSVYLIYKEYYNTSCMTMLQFRESLVRSLLLGVPFENLKSGPRKHSTNQTKQKSVDYNKLVEMEGSAWDV